MPADLPYAKPGLTAVTPFLAVPDIDAAIAFYVRALDAREVRRDPDQTGVVRHAVLSIAGAPFELGLHSGTTPPTDFVTLAPVTMHLFVPDVDAVYARATAAGGRGRPPYDMPYGDREAGLVDPFGITWWIATRTSGR